MASTHVLELGGDNWAKEVENSDKPVLVDFWATWCPPCVALTPVIERVAAKYADRVKVGKVNVDEHPDLASEFGISSIPRLFVFNKSKKPVHSMVGLKTEGELGQVLDKVLAGA